MLLRAIFILVLMNYSSQLPGIERAVLEYAGLVESKRGIDAQLLSVMENLSDEDKRNLLFDLLNSNNAEEKS